MAISELLEFFGAIGNFLWQEYTFWVLIGAGVLFTLWTKFSQFKALTHGVAVVRGKYDSPDDPGAINHFQALSTALSATVGLGNIGGVALAVGMGGPGAIFWMWVIGFLGMAIKTVEVSLSMLYRDTSNPDDPRGGAMWVIDKTLGTKGPAFMTLAKIMGTTFCVTLLISTMTGGNMFQAWSVADLTFNYFGVPEIVTGIVLAVIVGVVIIGGIKRIGSVAGKLVPFMCAIYILAALAVLAKHIGDIPGYLGSIVTSAFSKEDATGAFLGGGAFWALNIGLRRALFSNEAGQGSAPIAHAAAKTDVPVREGIVSGLEPFIDTICICTITALVILSTGTWNRDAAGNFARDIQLVTATTDADGQPLDGGDYRWTVSTDGSVEDLPAPESGDTWNNGTRFFLVAEVAGAKHQKMDTNRVQVVGTITADPDDPDAPPTIDWGDVTISSSEWTGTPTGASFIDPGVFQEFEGASLTAYAFDREYPGLGKWLVTIAAWLFAISTMISWSYYGEQGVVYIADTAGLKSLTQPLTILYKLAFLMLAIVAAVFITDGNVMGPLMDLGTGAMLWANMPIVFLMGYIAVRELDTYFKKLKAGEFPSHTPASITDVVEGKDVE